jgi:hypothetical protein
VSEGPGGPGEAEAQLSAFGAALLAAAERAVGPWVQDAVARRVEAWSSRPPSPDVLRSAAAAARRAEAEVLPRLRALLEADVDEQRSTPLSVLRRLVPHATAVLAEAGVPPVQRDELAEAAFPEDLYDLSPASFAAFGPEVAEAGLHWGAAKAFVVLQRRR